MIQLQHTGKTLQLAGELTIYEVGEAKAEFAHELAQGAAEEVDLSGLQELDTAGAQLLLWLKREAAVKGRPLSLTRHSPAVLEVFDQLDLARLFGDTLLIPPAR